MRRFRPAVAPTIAAVAAIALFVSAGVWQHSRMLQKEELGAQLDAAARNAPVPLPDAQDWTAWRFRPVVATGTFDAPHQILIDNKVHGGRAGFDVVTPLAMTDGRVVLVDRGWVAAGESRARLPTAPPPSGAVAVQGRVNVPTPNYLELARGTTSGPLWQNLDLKRYADATGVAVLPVVVEQTAPLGGDDNLVRDWPAPDLGADRHRIYMAQWFLFAALVAALWAYFAWRKE
jgi:surfeit locus 1 family protein